MRQRPPITAEHERLGAALRTARQHSHLTQVQLAQKLGKPQSFIAKVEAGSRRLEVLDFVAYTRLLSRDPMEFLQAFLESR